MNVPSFPERLSSARKEKGLTQDGLAVRLGVTPQAISKWERGLGYPDILLLCSISEVLNCSTDHLLGRDPLGALTESDDEKAKKRLLGKLIADPLWLETGIGLVDMIVQEQQNEFGRIQEIREGLAAKYG